MTTADETIPHLMIHATTGESHTIQLRPRAGLTVADVEVELAGRRAEGLTIDPERCAVIKYYADPRDIYGLFDLDDSTLGEFAGACAGSELFVRNLPDGCWVWAGDLPGDIARRLAKRLGWHRDRDEEEETDL